MKALLISSALACSIIPAVAQQSQKQLSYTKMPLTLADSQGHYFAEISVEGKKAFYLVDTGCSTTFVTSKNLTEKLNVKLTETGEALTINGKVKRYQAKFKTMQFGNAKSLSSITSSVVDFGTQSSIKLKGKDQNVDGLLGSPLLKALRATLDYKNSHLLFAPKAAAKDLYAKSRHAAGDLLVKLSQDKSGSPYVPITLNGKKFLFLIDSGAAVNLLSKEAVEALQVKANQKADGFKAVTISNPILGHIQLPDLKFTIRNGVKAGTIQAKGHIYGGILGSRTLRRYSASLDFDSYYLIFDKSIKGK